MPRELRTEDVSEPQVGLLGALVGDGRSLLALLAVGLIASGMFALFLAATVTFLPQDVGYCVPCMNAGSFTLSFTIAYLLAGH